MEVSTDSRILKALEDWEIREGNLPESLQLFRNLLTLQTEAKAGIDISGLNLTRETIKERNIRGETALDYKSLCIDWSLLAGVVEKVSRLVSSESDSGGGLSGSSSKVPTGLLKKAVKAWFEGAPLHGNMINGFEEDFIEAVISASLKPFLSLHAEALIPLVNMDLWRRGYCPICGGSPDLSFLEKEFGARWLLCSRCDAKWLFQRMECHSCGSRDQNQLAYYSDEKGLYRLYTCEQCKSYLKTIDLRQSQEEVLLPLERFITLDLDRQAHEKGYTAGGGDRKAALCKEE